MNKRQRKKNKVGEFVQFGFPFRIFVAGKTFDRIAFVDELIEYAESKSLLVSMGEYAPTVIGIMLAHRGKCLRSVTTDEHFDFIFWLRKHPKVEEFTVLSLRDVKIAWPLFEEDWNALPPVRSA